MSKRKALFVVASLCGHSSPDITTLHYIHLLDWMLGVELSRKNNEPIFDANKIAFLTGKSRKQVYYRFKKNQIWQLSSFLPNDVQNEIKKYKIKTKTPKQMTAQNKDNKLDIPWRLINTVLKTHYESNRSPADLAKLFSICEYKVTTWITNEKKIKSIEKTPGVSQHLEHRFRKTPDKASLPKLFEKNTELKLIKKFFKKIMHIDSGDRFILQENIQYFIQSYSAGSKGVSFYRNKYVINYLKFLKIVGITNKQIHVCINMPNAANKAAYQQLIKILKNFKIPLKNVESIRSTHPLAIWIQVKTTEKSKTAQRYGSSGFLFCIYITAMALNFICVDEGIDELIF